MARLNPPPTSRPDPPRAPKPTSFEAGAAIRPTIGTDLEELGRRLDDINGLVNDLEIRLMPILEAPVEVGPREQAVGRSELQGDIRDKIEFASMVRLKLEIILANLCL